MSDFELYVWCLLGVIALYPIYKDAIDTFIHDKTQGWWK